MGKIKVFKAKTFVYLNDKTYGFTNLANSQNPFTTVQ